MPQPESDPEDSLPANQLPLDETEGLELLESEAAPIPRAVPPLAAASAALPPDEPIEFVVPPEVDDVRLDWYLAQKFPLYSRTLLRKAINAATVRVDGQTIKASHRVSPGETVSVEFPDLPHAGPEPENIPLDILYEDAFLAVINKPPRMVVHPGKGNWSGTLTAALAFHFNSLSSAGGASRPGIVHRLDRDTSGVLVVAKDDRTHHALSAQFADRTISKRYFAIALGQPGHDRDWIDQPIGLHPHQREKMMIRKHDPAARPAQTFYEVAERFRGYSTLTLAPKTGRTHQLRVHLASIGCPIVCDRLYGTRPRLLLHELMGNPVANGADEQVLLDRQALHAERLEFTHPHSGERVAFSAPLPSDMAQVIAALQAHRR